MVSGHPVVWCDDPARHTQITDRQSDVAYLLMQGYRVAEIANQLDLGTETARMHVKNLHARLGTRNLHSLALWCWQHRECCLRRSDGDVLVNDERSVNIAANGSITPGMG